MFSIAEKLSHSHTLTHMRIPDSSVV